MGNKTQCRSESPSNPVRFKCSHSSTFHWIIPGKIARATGLLRFWFPLRHVSTVVSVHELTSAPSAARKSCNIVQHRYVFGRQKPSSPVMNKSVKLQISMGFREKFGFRKIACAALIMLRSEVRILLIPPPSHPFRDSFSNCLAGHDKSCARSQKIISRRPSIRRPSMQAQG